MEFIEMGDGMKLYFSSNDFINSFNTDFEDFKNVYPDADMNGFITVNISFYRVCIENTEYVTLETGEAIIKSELLGTNSIPEILQKISNSQKVVDEVKRKQAYFSFNAILNFLTTKLNQIDQKEIPDNIPLMDFSNAKGTEKIVMLQQLGILDFLKTQQPFIQSTNKLAEVLSGITGENATTIQSYINPMNDARNDQKNNPMAKPKLVSKVNQTLINIGYIPPK